MIEMTLLWIIIGVAILEIAFFTITFFNHETENHDEETNYENIEQQITARKEKSCRCKVQRH
mgnify:CR=1 FL=1